MARYQRFQTSLRMHVKLCCSCVPVSLCKMLSLFLKVGSFGLCKQCMWRVVVVCVQCTCGVWSWCVFSAHVACGWMWWLFVQDCFGLFGADFNEQVLAWFSEFLQLPVTIGVSQSKSKIHQIYFGGK